MGYSGNKAFPRYNIFLVVGPASSGHIVWIGCAKGTVLLAG
jgi:hypothetical protein